MNIFPFLASNAEAVGAPAISWDAPGIILLKLLAVVFLVLLNGFFVASEFAIVKVRSSQLDALAARGNGLANWLVKCIFHLDPVAAGELAHSEEELRLILDESAKAARICPVSHEIVANAFEIRRRVVREVMTPRREVVYLNAGLGIYEMRDLAGLEWKDEDVTTVGGYVVHRLGHLGHLPRVGEQVHLDDYIVTVEQADGRRVQQLRFQRVAKRDSRER